MSGHNGLEKFVEICFPGRNMELISITLRVAKEGLGRSRSELLTSMSTYCMYLRCIERSMLCLRSILLIVLAKNAIDKSINTL